MFRKTLTALAVAGALILSGAGAALADVDSSYPPSGTVTANPPSIQPGQTDTITATGLPAAWEGLLVTFTVTSGPSGSTLSSIVLAATTSPSVQKTVVNGTASATFTATTPGAYTVTVTGPEGQLVGSATVTVVAASTGGLPVTGGSVPAGAIWLGIGAIGIGGIAVAAVAARRRARNN